MKRGLLILLLLLAATEFVVRGPIRYFRTSSGWSDIMQIYVPARAWLQGKNPYSADNFVTLYHLATNLEVDRDGFRSHSPHPLTALVVFSPLAALPWWLAHLLWTALIAAIIIPAILCLNTFLDGGGSHHRLALAAMTLALAPLHSGIAAGNVSIPAIALCSVAFWAADQDKENLAGALIAVAACLKPQIGGLFLLYYLLRRRWKVALVAMGIGAAVFVLGVVRLQWAGTPWWNDFLENARAARHNRLMDFAIVDPLRFTMLNLQVPFYALWPSSLLANAAALFIGLGLWGRWAWSDVRRAAPHAELLLASAFLVIGLLPVYHRNYDATLLIFPLCWALSPQAASYGRARVFVLLTMIPFLLPGPTLLQSLADRKFLPQSITGGWWWDGVVLPHQTWLLLILSIILLHALAAGPKTASA